MTKNHKSKKTYTLKQIKDKFLPNRDLASLESTVRTLNKQEFMAILGRVSEKEDVETKNS